jgi:hypothetical protein
MTKVICYWEDVECLDDNDNSATINFDLISNSLIVILMKKILIKFL